jgi:hypothetical protein
MAAENQVRGIRIPESRLDFDYDPFAEFAKSTGSGPRNNPYAEFARRRKIAPIHPLTLAEALGAENLPRDEQALALLKAMWAIDGEVFGAYSHEAVSEILRDAERFNSFGYTRNIGLVYDHSILEMDGAEHLRHRALINEAFHPAALQRWVTEHFTPVINQVIDNFAPRGEAELVRDFTFVYPVKIIAGLLGVPLEHWQWYQRCSVELITFSRLERALEVCSLLKDYFSQIIELRRAHPSGDLISELVEARIDGQRLSNEEILPFLLILGKEVAFRGDAAFAKPALYESVEARETKYAIRLPANDNLERTVAQLLTRPLGRPSYKPVVRYKSFFYQAASWTRARRMAAKVEFHFGELFPRVGFIVTNFQTSSRALVCFYKSVARRSSGSRRASRRSR